MLGSPGSCGQLVHLGHLFLDGAGGGHQGGPLVGGQVGFDDLDDPAGTERASTPR